ncbi:MAG TPA: type II secretion system protein [Gaiellaceae bacterium]|nr:type II secretion system protein [Gaiellaceae bacterium]
MRVVTTITRRPSVLRLREESGQGLLELLAAIAILSIGVASLLTLLAAGAVSLQRSQRDGTALTVAEGQLELYRGVAYPYIRLSATALAAVPGSSVYMTANASDSTIPSGASSSQVLDTTSGNQACTTDDAALCAPVQTVTGPDHHSYEIDTYITQCPDAGLTSCPPSADPVKQVFVVVRDAAKSTLPIVAREGSTFSSWTTATG